MRPTHHVTAALAAVLLGSLGCGDDPSEEENPNAEACEHIEAADTAIGLTAAATASASAPEIRADHTRYDVTTVPVAGGKGGYVTFAAAEAGDYIFFTGTPVQLTVRNPAGADVAAESSAASIPECTQVKGRHVYPLQVGTHVIGITTTADKVSFVVEGSDEH
jgi:hypothetical protein